jgi:ribose-phosphate pyrophosphokinase
MKLNLAIDAAKRAAAKEIIPFYHISHMLVKIKDQSRPIGKVIVEMIENRGATGVITYDLHADQIQGF